MNILVIVPNLQKISGVDYWRLMLPHNYIGKNYDCTISVINEIDSQPNEFLTQFDFIVANRFISKIHKPTELITRLKAIGVPYILDLDDDYVLPKTHLLYQAAKEHDHTRHIAESVKSAYAVTCTHEVLAETLKAELGQKNIFICPNGIDPVGQFTPRAAQTDRVTFGWSGSITHFDDVMLTHDALYYMYKQHPDFAMVYGGYDKQDLTSSAIAGVLSCKGMAGQNQFSCFPAAEVERYAEFYDCINVALIPLRDNRFNNMKSNLKLLEAGFKKRAVIISNVFPYSPILQHGRNCLVVNHGNDWVKHMVALKKNPRMIETLANNLHEDVQQFHISKVAEARYNAYQTIFNQIKS